MTPEDLSWRSRRLDRDAMNTAAATAITAGYFGMMGAGGGAVVLDLAGEPVAEPGHAPDVHAHREVLALDVRR